MIIENAQYRKGLPNDSTPVEIRATIDGEVVSIPIDTSNRHYAEAMRRVAEGTLIVADAD
jgi:pyridoxal biosynthesis lyase PdxS